MSIYVHPNTKGKGVGDLILAELIKRSEKHGFWTLQSGIFPENLASLNLHKKHGFRELGRRERIGKMNGVWRDTLLYFWKDEAKRLEWIDKRMILTHRSKDHSFCDAQFHMVFGNVKVL